MIQTPPPAFPQIPFDWLRFIDNDLMPFLVVLVVGVGLLFALRVIMKSPVGEAMAERIRRKTNLKYGDSGTLSGEQTAVQLDSFQDQLNRIEAHLAEVNERLDFTERVLSKKDPNAIGPAR
ncbi:MAG TPA: hypothetical protein VH113_09920 [Gemmatimonadales bacterium]|nr:hypothetical protein [Gemmatimonadales bacterium]